jgi:aryl-alcohol dehydrogenase-like predicted oxidoreductase
MNRYDAFIDRLALGTVQFGLDYGISNTGGQTSSSEVKKILSRSLQVGLNMLDTASGYGESEKLIGENNPEHFKIISKFPASVKSSDDIKNSLKTSLSDLNETSLYGYLAHEAQNLINYPHLWPILQEFKAAGTVKKIGYSLYLPEQLSSLLDAGYIPDIVQLPYNFADRRFEKYFGRLKQLGCEIHVRSVFLQGLFFVDPANLTNFFEPVKPLLLAIRRHFSGNKQIAAFLMNFCLSAPDVDKIIFGVNTEMQFRENINNIYTKFTPFTFEDIQIPQDILMPNKWPK